MQVLIVDDDYVMLEFLNEIIQDLNFSCFQASNGEDALDIFLHEHVDVIISDYNMPIMNGIEFRLEIDCTGKLCPPFILFTSNIFEAKTHPYRDKFDFILDKLTELKSIPNLLKQLEHKIIQGY